ncbi:MAG: hypothetical protein EOO48_06265, partial [Flavobacterium sp.]
MGKQLTLTLEKTVNEFDFLVLGCGFDRIVLNDNMMELICPDSSIDFIPCLGRRKQRNGVEILNQFKNFLIVFMVFI